MRYLWTHSILRAIWHIYANRKMKVDVNGEDATYYFSKNGWAYQNSVVSSTVYGKDGKLQDDYGDGSTYERVKLSDVTDAINSAGKYILRGKATGSVVVEGDANDEVLINGYGRIKTSGSCKDIDGDTITVTKGIVTKIETK